jgi:hypothetical protein
MRSEPTPPPLRVPISIRTYAEEEPSAEQAAKALERPKPRKRTSRRMRERAGPTEWMLVFDTETTTGASQRFKVGFYRLYQGDRLDEERIFFDPAALTTAEIETVQAYAISRNLDEPLTLDVFREAILIGRGVKLGGTVLTFNGPFDFARVALGWGPARASSWRRKMQGGFSLRLTDNEHTARLQLKSLNARTTLAEFTAPRAQGSSRSVRKRAEKTPAFRGFHIDVKTFASALTSRSHSLESLTQTLDTPTKKVASQNHGEELTPEYLDYARTDVQATKECYDALSAKFKSYGLNAAAHTITSEASLGKSALATMGIQPWTQVQPGGVDKALNAQIMSTYYGGRTEVHIRRSLVQVLLTDFTSMYTTVCTLQGLWRFVIGTGFTGRGATAEIRALVAGATADQFQNPSAWPSLTALICLKPGHDLVPIRAAYVDAKSATQTGRRKPANSNIGLNYLTFDGRLWYTLADVLVAKFLSGKTPDIDEAIIFEPGERQAGLKPIQLMGRHKIDPNKDDLFRELIRARQADEADKEGRSDEEKEKIEEGRALLKLVANATSYGIFVQFNVNADAKGSFVRVFRPNGGSFLKRMKKIETAGPWFNPLVATLITGAARLMLALAEHRALAEGLDWAFCDTDSLAIAKPQSMKADEFVRRALRVVDWFQPLNPYGFPESILKIEKQNYATAAPRRLEPLFCWAISSKRYALFNIAADGQAIIRKASAHGLGHLITPYEAKDAPTCFPAPLPSVLSGREKLQRWHYDVWCAVLKAVLSGEPDNVRFDYHPALGAPTASYFTASSPEYVNWFKGWNRGKIYADQVKPFGFLYILHLSRFADHPDQTRDPLDEGGDCGVDEVYPVAPFDRNLKMAVSRAFDRSRAVHTPVSVDRLQTYAEMLAAYPFRAEGKFLNGRPYDSGHTQRHHIVATSINLIGKEAERMEEEYVLGVRGELAIDYGGDPVEAAHAAARLRKAIIIHGNSAVARATGISRGTLSKISRGGEARTNVAPARIIEALKQIGLLRSAALEAQEAERAQLIRLVATEGGVRPAARRLNLDPSNLAKKLKQGRAGPPPFEV